ncbi:fructose-6-phosphate aldolase [Candidatus Marinimicrobia bacterium MT.SAG.3]|nr:fructose-6-phosphate aldolase [Candidatus Marinimicrobia bacterium MT.SAG.4]TFB12527.1 fructose-6-phosphate aldolase [Candidatus Marinimicrobia bacterium MT.SAG.3]
MKIFLDTANVEEIKEGASWGIVDGVTTNPSLIAKEGRDFETVIKEICEIVDGPVNAEVVGLKTEEMITEGRKLRELHDNICVKIPMTVDGIKAVKVLSGEGTMTNVTLIFSSLQALLAAKAGATFVSPFVGRIDDMAMPGMDLIADISQIYENYGYETEIIVASIRNPLHVVDTALYGADIATLPMKVLHQMAKHPLTDRGIEQFLKDWESMKS